MHMASAAPREPPTKSKRRLLWALTAATTSSARSLSQVHSSSSFQRLVRRARAWQRKESGFGYCLQSRNRRRRSATDTSHNTRSSCLFASSIVGKQGSTDDCHRVKVPFHDRVITMPPLNNPGLSPRARVCAESDSHEAEYEGVDEPAAFCFSQLEH